MIKGYIDSEKKNYIIIQLQQLILRTPSVQ